MASTRPKVITSGGEQVTHFDLDALEHEARHEPFTFTLAGEVFTMRGPEEVDWQVLADLDEAGTVAFVRELLGEGWERFSSHKIPSWKLNALIDACAAHYGAAPGESRASANS